MKDLTTAEKRENEKLLNERTSIQEISKDLCRDHQTIKKTVENIIKLRSRGKGKSFKNLLSRDGYKFM